MAGGLFFLPHIHTMSSKTADKPVNVTVKLLRNIQESPIRFVTPTGREVFFECMGGEGERFMGHKPANHAELDELFNMTLKPHFSSRFSIVSHVSEPSEPTLVKYNGLSKDELVGLCNNKGIGAVDADTVTTLKRLLEAYNLGVKDG